MLDFAILSRHAVPNYGSLLQAYALQKTLEEFGVSVEYINYQNREERIPARFFTLLRLSHWNRSWLRRIIFFLTKVPVDLCAFLVFGTFQKRLLYMSKLYRDLEELKEKMPEAKAFLTGSDQVWNVFHQQKLDKTYFFPFSNSGTLRFSYAASMGNPEKMEQWKETIGELLQTYQRISVREARAKEFLAPVGKYIDVVCDPVFLQTKEQWCSFMGAIPPISQKYILVYCLAKNKRMENFARELATRTGCSLIAVNAYYTQLIGDYDKRILLPSPERFLSLIQHAQYVVTDSFHGTAFSILLHKQFVEFIPEGNPCRNIELLKRFELEDRIILNSIDSPNGIELIQCPIDYASKKKKMEQYRQEGIDYLKRCIEEIS